jgi:hypothetical protein
VLISLCVKGRPLVRLTQMLEALQVPFLYTVSGRSASNYSLEAIARDIERVIEVLTMQGDNNIRH